MRRQNKPIFIETPESLRLDYLTAAAYDYYRAEGADENLASALNRIRARRLQERLLNLGMALPKAEEVQAYAAAQWPRHKVHAL